MEEKEGKKMWSSYHPSCTHDIHKKVECPKVDLGQLSPASSRDPICEAKRMKEN